MQLNHSLTLLRAIGLGFVLASASARGAAPAADMESEIRDDVPRGLTPSLYANDLESAGTLGVGRIAADVANNLPALEEVTAWLAPGAIDLGFDKVRPVIARDNEEMVEFLRRGIVDVVSETPMSALFFVEAAGASIILREHRGGQAAYRSVILVQEDSPIASLAGLRGRRLACKDAGSTAAFLFPIAAIKRAGVGATKIFDAAEAPAKDSVSYFFTGSESSVLSAVARGTADAGAMNEEDWNRFRHEKPGVTSKLRVLYESELLPRGFVLTGPAITAKQRDGIRELMLTMANDKRGLEALAQNENVDGFDPIGDALEHEIATLRETYALVRDHLRNSVRRDLPASARDYRRTNDRDDISDTVRDGIPDTDGMPAVAREDIH
jgi:phosphonate transport system substrate-binding protein